MFWVALIAASVANPCSGHGTSVVVSTAERELRLCSDGAVEQSYHVALGRQGSGKSREGDLKTPLGMYVLGPRQPSRRFHAFLPIGYPTAGQRARGLSGGSVGLHGPDRRFAWAGHATTWIDWTRGCIAVGSDQAIDAIAEWVRRGHVEAIHIE